MTTKNSSVSIFVSHHTVTHRAAAARIKELLEGRTERLVVRICEEIVPGDDWLKEIVTQISHSKILLVLVPQQETAWIDREIKIFQEKCPNGRIVILKPPSFPTPPLANEIQIIEATAERIHKSFLELLFHKPDLAGQALNVNVTHPDMVRDAAEIADALVGLVNIKSETFSESLIVDTLGCGPDTGWASAVVHAPQGCPNTLDWTLSNFTWAQLRQRAEEDQSKGTFWIAEMEYVMSDVAAHSTPRIMSSTFRGRGQASGRIFRPHLERVDRVDDLPVRFYFAFPEVLVPELVRGPGDIGVVASLIHLASRVRWEVLEPFLVNQCLSSGALPSSDSDRKNLIGQVERSLRVIDEEAERHNIVSDGIKLFEGEHAEIILNMFRARAKIKAAIADAIDHSNFDQLIEELTHSLDFNTQAMQILIDKYRDLVGKDRADSVSLIANFDSRNLKSSTQVGRGAAPAN